MITVETRPCMFCGKKHHLTVNESALRAWQGGVKIQHAFPELNADERELLISGTCPKCWDENMKPDDDE